MLGARLTERGAHQNRGSSAWARPPDGATLGIRAGGGDATLHSLRPAAVTSRTRSLTPSQPFTMSTATTHHTILALLTATSLASAYAAAAGWTDSGGQGITNVHVVR